MRVSSLLTFLFLVTICLNGAFVWAESSPLSNRQSDETTSTGKKSGMDTNIEGEKSVSSGQTGEIVSENKGSATNANTESEKLEPVSAGQPGETAGVGKSSVKDTNIKSEKLGPVDVEFETTFSSTETASISDPIQPYNRSIFVFNDKAYYYVVKPVYKGYNKAVPEKARVSVRNFFSNIAMPVRFFNCLFQGEFKGAGTELARFVINTTFGVAGFSDPAKSLFHLEKQNRDFGQTLAKYKIGTGPFVEWPFIGPSSARDTVGFVGDLALNPLTLLSFFAGPFVSTGVNSYDYMNEVSIDKGEAYESITKPAIDPYIALQDAYVQNRIKRIKE
ncbi:MAG: VacJ family lipoprotein [Planctomycetes bacterium]|nr:VacJ family lipoprotein [Planctomycetota bacterium]